MIKRIVLISFFFYLANLLLSYHSFFSSPWGRSGGGSFFSALTASAQSWKKVLRTNDSAFYTTEEARRIGDQLIAYQRVTGGWAKNIDVVKPLSDEELQKVLADKSRTDDSTTDNDATNIQLLFLARLYQATGEKTYRQSFLQGIEYLLSGQYDNGGWPQFWPNPRGYQVHITYNDNAMINTLRLFQQIVRQETPFSGKLTSRKLRRQLETSISKGIDIILKTQIRDKDGELTVWCQQHDRNTLLPAKARAYELPSYCSAESAEIVQFLMSQDNPSEQIQTAIHSAMKWFGKYRLAPSQVSELKRTEAPTWARFYDLEQCEPLFCDRDGIPRKHLEEVGEERRNGYAWYVGTPQKLFSIYEDWKAKLVPTTGEDR